MDLRSSKGIAWFCAPVLVYLPLTAISNLLLKGELEPWKSWLVLSASAGFMICSPIIKSFDTKRAKAVAFFVGFVIWLVLLFSGTLLATWILTGDSL